MMACCQPFGLRCSVCIGIMLFKIIIYTIQLVEKTLNTVHVRYLAWCLQ